MAKKQILTTNGYDLFEVSSAFQKAIRRGDEQQALTWATELWNSGYQKYGWKRMAIMVSEDVGMGEPQAPSVFKSLLDLYTYFTQMRNETGKLQFYHAVLYLVKCRKSRYVDLIIAKYEYQFEMDDGSIEIPDYAFDMHTRKGKRMGRGLEHFYDEGMIINNANKVEGEEELEEQCRFYDKEMEKIEQQKKDDNPASNEKPDHSQGKLFE